MNKIQNIIYGIESKTFWVVKSSRSTDTIGSTRSSISYESRNSIRSKIDFTDTMIAHIGNIECLFISGESKISWGIETGSNTVTFNESGSSISGYERSGVGYEIYLTDAVVRIVGNIEEIIGFIEGKTIWGIETSRIPLSFGVTGGSAESGDESSITSSKIRMSCEFTDTVIPYNIHRTRR